VSFDVDRLYDLLPAVHRDRDEREGGPLRALLAVMAEQAIILEESLDQLYDDQFIETCAEWVAPYIGALIGYRPLHGVAPSISSPRAEVAHTIAFRRRKGTASMLEQLARDVTGWDANVVEYFLRIGQTQYMNHIRPRHWYAPDLRAGETLEWIGGPFDDIAHTVDVRRIESGHGRYNIPNIGIFLWRLDDFRLTESPAVRLDDRRYLFSPLGNNTPLFTRPEPEPEISHLARPINVPAPITRRVLHADLDPDAPAGNYYGVEKSLFIVRDGSGVDIADVVACDLSDAGGGLWAHRPQDKTAIDPVLGRIAFAENQAPPGAVLVDYSYGFARAMSGGEYDRAESLTLDLAPVRQVGGGAAIQPELDAVQTGGVVEITDSGRYDETPVPTIDVAAGEDLELRGQNRTRPTLVLSGSLTVDIGAEGAVTLNGLLIAGGAIRVPATINDRKVRTLRLRHCTLVPGLSLTIDGAPEHADAPSLIVEQPDVEVEIDQCIVGGLRIVRGSSVCVTNSIVDATNPAGLAYTAPDEAAAGNGIPPPPAPGGTLWVINSTIIGGVQTVSLEYASNAIFLGDVLSERRQAGCVRFSWLDLAAAVPQRYRCQPDFEIAERAARLERDGTILAAAQRAAIETEVVAWLRPRFTSTRYGDPGYGQLHRNCPVQIREGADDEAEMGAFHDLFAPQRETNLRVRLEEYLRFGLEAGIFYAT
jgi:hypothetical protein